MNKVFAKNLMGQSNNQFCFGDKDGMLCFGSAYSAIRFADEELDVAVCGMENQTLIEKVFTKMSNEAKANLCIPSRDDIAAIVKGSRRDGGAMRLDLAQYNDGDESAPVVNAFFLLDILRLFGKEKPFAYHSGKMTDPIYFWKWDGDSISVDAILFGVMRTKKATNV